jgi:hypothetical protein
MRVRAPAFAFTAQNPDVMVYDKTGLRTAMTTSVAAMNASLGKCRPDHQPTPAWALDAATVAWMEKMAAAGQVVPGKPKFKTISRWQTAQINDW